MTPPLITDPAPNSVLCCQNSPLRHLEKMVSTHSQYITDFNSAPSMTESGKSPLALLAKTCETIGLPDTPAKRSPEKKDVSSPLEGKKAESPAPLKKKDGSRSPRSTPKATTSEPSTSTGVGMPKPPFPMAMTGIPGLSPFPMAYPGMMPYPHIPFPGFAGMMNPFMRMPDPSMFGKCPSALLGRPCVTPGCTQCPSTADSLSAAASAFPGFPSFPYPFMPTTSVGATLPASYQQLLQASAAAAATHQQTATVTKQHMCSWMDNPASGVCGKQFHSAEELANHVKSAHTTANNSPPAKSPSTPIPTSRYHPYSKPGTITTPTSAPPMLHFSPMHFPAAAMAMYSQRLMSTMPHN